MAGPPQLLYLEPDDEITSVVRRLRESDADRVVLVASGRSKASTSAVALRLLAGVAEDEGRHVALVADAAGRVLAAEAGIPAYPSVAEASAEGAVPAEPPEIRRAPIHVVRGEAPTAPARSAAETQAVPVAIPAPRQARHGPRPPRAPRAAPVPGRAILRARGLPRAALGALVALLLVAAALLAAVAPAATIVIEPRGVAVGPVEYAISLPPDGSDQGEVSAEAEGTATGVFRDPSPATGSVVFWNYNTVTVEVSEGTVVAAGETLFVTTETIIVPNGLFGLPIIPGEASVGIVAEQAGPGGNVEADAIDTIVTDGVRNFLRGFPNNPNRLVENPEATGGGAENRQPEVTQEDVDAAVAAVHDALTGRLEEELTEEPGRVYAQVQLGDPAIVVPEDLVGTRGEETFLLGGTLGYRRDYLERSTVEEAARRRLLEDADTVPDGARVLPETIEVRLEEVGATGGRLNVRVVLTAEAAHLIDIDAIRDRVAGLTGAQAAELLQPLGDVRVELWPGWVDRVPQLTWRIDVSVVGGEVGESPPPTASSAPSPAR